MSTPRSTYLPEIDGLRAFAVGAVLLFHAGHLGGGFLGVDAFFVVSGFLITRQMLQEVDTTDRIALGAFWARRARRLLPALVVLLVVVIGVAYRFGFAGERFKIRDEAPWALGFALNWHHIGASTDYWTSLSSPSPLTHLWSLAVEEQFYLLWPLVMLLLVRRRRSRERTVLIGSAIGAMLSFALMALVFEPGATTRAYEGTDTRIGALLVGALCATTIVTDAADRVVARLGRGISLAVVVPAALLAWMWLRVDGRDGWMYHGGFLLHALLVAGLLLAVSSASGSTWLGSALRMRPVRWFGTLSYGLYLWHWPIYVALAPGRVHLGRWTLTLLRLVATIVAATLSYYLVERPARTGLQRRPKARTLMASVAGIAVVTLAIVVVPMPTSSPAPINLANLVVAGADTGTSIPASTTTGPESTTTAPAAVTTIGTTTTIATSTTIGTTASIATTTSIGTTTTALTPDPTTTTTAPPSYGELHRVLWLGDSIAFTTSLALAAAMDVIGVDVYDGSVPGVGLLNQAGPAYFEQITEHIAEQRPELVIFQMSTWDDEFGVEAIHAAIQRLRDLTTAVGARLLLLPVPPLRADQDHNGYRNDTEAAQQLAAEDPADVSFLSTTPVWGPTFEYDLDGDKVPERLNDGVHLCPAGAARFAIWLITQLSANYTNLVVADPATWALGDWTHDIRYNRLEGACALLP